jgi:S-formylglutathione hydrolase
MKSVGTSCAVVVALVVGAAAGTPQAAEYKEAEIVTEVVPSPVPYSVLLPDGYNEATEPYPLVLVMHGGGGSRRMLQRMKASLEQMWAEDLVPEFVAACASVTGGRIYMDLKTGEEMWETFLMKDFIPHLRATYNVSSDRKKTVATGTSMGGIGSLRLAFKYPEVFGAVAAMEPAMWPGSSWGEVPAQHKFRSQVALDRLFGKPFDHGYWEANNPASIAAANVEKLLASDLAIYLECGDSDAFGFHEAAEFLHRVLWDNGIPHEYRLVRWADHVGATMEERSANRFGFVARFLNPAPPDPAAERFRKQRALQNRAMGFEPYPFWPNEPVRIEPAEE